MKNDMHPLSKPFHLGFALMFAGLISVLPAFGQIPSLEDFTAQVPADDFQAPAADDPAKGIKAPTAVMAPEKVKVTKEELTTDKGKTIVVEAAHTQDAINASLQQMRTLKQDITMIKVGSGEGVVARGYALYRAYPNRNASLISKRQAYIKAHMQAKKNLMEFLYGLSNESKQDLDESVDAYDEGDGESLANTGAVTSDTASQKVEGLLRGSAVYEVRDDEQNSQVEVAIVTTPKTRGETMDVSGGVTQSKSIREGLGKVFAELKSGVLPPSGGKVITAGTGQGRQFYFLAFGSEINRTNKNPQVARTLRMASAKVAQQRAAANMCALIIGEQGSWKGGFSSKTAQSDKQYTEIADDDPANEKNGISAEPLAQTISSFVSTIKQKNSYSYAQRGQLPPGLQAIRWVSSDGDWSYAAYVYNPGLTLKARGTADAINNSGILNKGNTLGHRQPSQGGTGGAAHAGSKDAPSNIKKDAVGKGPDGKVSKDDDL